MTLAAGILLVALCLLSESFFSGSEIALVHADRLRLQASADEGSEGARAALDLLSHEERFLSTCLIGTNLATITGTTLVSTLLLVSLGRNDEWLVALCFVPLTLVLGEALPKTVYQHHADALAPVVARPMRVFQRVFHPLLLVASGWASVLARLVGTGSQAPVTRQDILGLLDESDDGVIDAGESKIIRRVFAISETPVEDCMTPLVEVEGVSEDDSIDSAVEVSVRSGHSRLPVWRERVDNIVGTVHASDLLFGEEVTVGSLMRPVRYVPESTRVDDLLRQLRAEGGHFAVVVDEYGGSVGIVTVEDLVEEIIGEIQDERDVEGPGIRRLGEREWRVPARVEVEAFEEVTGLTLPRGDYETVAGLILMATGRIPGEGEVVRVGRMRFEVEQANERAILQVRLTVMREK